MYKNLLLASLLFLVFPACQKDNSNSGEKINSELKETKTPASKETTNNKGGFIASSGKYFGPVTSQTKPEDLQKLFPDATITPWIMSMEGMVTDIRTKVYSGTKKVFGIRWNTERKPLSVIVNTMFMEKSTSPHSISPFGIEVGTDLSRLAEINQKPIVFYGFEWDEHGEISNLNEGKLQEIGFQGNIFTSDAIPGNVYSKFIGSDEFSTASISKEEIAHFKLGGWEIPIAGGTGKYEESFEEIKVACKGDSARVRKSPSLEAEVVAALQKNDEVFVLGSDTGAEVNGDSSWIYIRTPGGKTGFVHQSLLNLY